MAVHFVSLLNHMVHNPGLCPVCLHPADFICTWDLSAFSQSWVKAHPRHAQGHSRARICRKHTGRLSVLPHNVPSLRSLPTMNLSEETSDSVFRAPEELVFAAQHTLGRKVSTGEWVDKPDSAQAIRKEHDCSGVLNKCFSYVDLTFRCLHHQV